MRSISIVIACLIAGAQGMAQQVWTVPSGADPTPFVAAASPGDILLLSDNHPIFQLNKGLVIVGLGPSLAPGTGTVVGGLSTMQVNVPAGQRASLVGFSLDSYSWNVPTVGLQLLSGEVHVSDVRITSGVRVDGTAILERVRVASGGVLVNGLCEITDSVLFGRDASGGWGGSSPTPGIQVNAANSVLVASGVTATGGVGANLGPSLPSFPGAPGLSGAAGTAFVTDSSFTGGAAGTSISGGVGIAGIGSVSIARTTWTEGAGATSVSFGYQVVPEMVGLRCVQPPVRGSSLLAIATAGTQQEPLGIVGGLDRSVNVLPPIVEPLFGIPSQLFALALAVPAPGATVPVSLAVPNLPTLLGAEVWLQAVQLTGASIRASAVVGGTIR